VYSTIVAKVFELVSFFPFFSAFFFAIGKPPLLRLIFARWGRGT
jgi:hypothetical protein